MFFKRRKFQYPEAFRTRVLAILGDNPGTRTYLEHGSKHIGSMLTNFDERAVGMVRAITVRTLLDQREYSVLDQLLKQELEKAALYREWQRIWANKSAYMVAV